MKNILIIILLVIGFASMGFINNYNNSMQGINNSIVKACGYDASKGMISECD
jgi:hypothetical protein